MSTKISKARLAALEVIQNVEKNQAFARATLDNTLRHHQLSHEDRAFATKLSLGVAQTMQTLDELIYDCVDKRSDIKKNVLVPLRISTYEIVYLEKEPHAAVDQGVELVGIVEPRAKGLANFVLHKIVRHKKKFPFGDPEQDRDAFCRVYSMPKWIYQYMVDDIGEEKAKIITSSCNGQPPCFIFVNSVRSNVDEIEELFQNADGNPKRVSALCGVVLNNCLRIDRAGCLQDSNVKNAMAEGKFIIADAGGQGVCEFALMSYGHDGAPQSILEICAGTGNKAIMLQSIAFQKTGRQPSFVTIDNIEYKTNELVSRCKTCGIEVQRALTADALNISEQTKQDLGLFEHVLVDSPCSGLGTMRRHPEIKWRLTPEVIVDLANQSLELLGRAAGFVQKGGYLTYATCTVSTIENMGVVDKFLKSELGSHFVLAKFAYNGATHDSYNSQTMSGLNDCHFAAQLRRVK